jgi:mannose-6-phosphate isomerase-like protein (cupin superfamily)
VFKIIDLKDAPSQPMEPGRGTTQRLINATLGTAKIDVHVNRLLPGGPRGKIHRHSKADNVYIVRSGEGTLIADGTTYLIHKDQVIYIPAGMPHSLSNLSDDIVEIFEIYTPAGPDFDFEIVE